MMLASMFGGCQAFLDLGDDAAKANGTDASSADAEKVHAASSTDAPSGPDASPAADAAASDAKSDDSGVPAPCNKALDCERVVFVTSVLYTGNLAGLAGADATCTQLASGSPLARVRGRNYVAWLSGFTEFVSTRVQHGTGPYVRPDGNRVADGWPGFANPMHAGAIDIDETGKAVAGTTNVWTGSDAYGTPESGTCGEWTSQGAVLGAYGMDTAVDESWSHAGDAVCNGLAHLYCIEE